VSNWKPGIILDAWSAILEWSDIPWNEVKMRLVAPLLKSAFADMRREP
jgi:hypothetical protein